MLFFVVLFLNIEISIISHLLRYDIDIYKIFDISHSICPPLMLRYSSVVQGQLSTVSQPCHSGFQVRAAPNERNLRLYLRSGLSGSNNILKTDIKKYQICPILGRSDPI